MVDLPALALFGIAALALTMTPGPDMLLIASRSASQSKPPTTVPRSAWAACALSRSVAASII